MAKPKAGQRRQRREMHGVLQLRCYGTFHDGDWLSSDRFYKSSSTGIFSTWCKECHAYYTTTQRGFDPSQRIELVRKWVWEIIYRCDGMNAAARTMGISHSTLYRWLGRYKGYEQRRIRRESVKVILTTLAGLRNGTITPVTTEKIPNKNSGKTFRYGCKGCGCELTLFSPGCKTCNSRKEGVQRRESTDQEILRAKWREERKRRQRRKLHEVA